MNRPIEPICLNPFASFLQLYLQKIMVNFEN